MRVFLTKNVLFEYFWVGIWKQYCHIWNEHPWICLIAKFWEIKKMLKFGTRNALVRYFQSWISKKPIIYYIWNQNPQICLNGKFFKETKMPKFGTGNVLFGYFWQKMSYLSIFGLELEKKYCHIWNPRP